MKTTLTMSLCLLFLSLGAAGCDKKADTAAEEAKTSAETETTAAEPAPVRPKYIIGFEPQENPKDTEAKAQRLADFISEKSGIKVGILVPEKSGGLVDEMSDKEIHLAYMSAWPYIAAHLEADADLLVVEERGGKTEYSTTFFVRADSDIAKVEDFEGKKIAFTTPTSTSGYLFPMMKLIDAGVVERDDDLADYAEEVVFMGGYQDALQALIAGEVDVAAVADYAPDVYLSDVNREKIKPVASHGPIPTHVVAVRAEVPMDDRKKLQEAFMALNEVPNQALLEEVYGAEKFVIRSHGDHVYALQRELEQLDVDYPVD